MILGIVLSQGTAKETLSNETGSKSFDYDVQGLKVALGKDFDVYNVGMQTSRFLLLYKYNELDTGAAFETLAVGYRENMRYWPVYMRGMHSIYPLASIEGGYTSVTKGAVDASGLSFQADVGLAYLVNDVEFTLAATSSYIDWDHPEAGISDTMKTFSLAVGLTYRFMD